MCFWCGNSCASQNQIIMDIDSDNGQFKLIKDRLAPIVSALIHGVLVADSIGDIVESTGVGGIIRNNKPYLMMSVQISIYMMKFNSK